ncbi:hypothetical protein [Pseudoscardovia radai]|uniref:hypothetical protein n=1 Tax=Pseudoscardovia radai TaxID=987066 RepID=UPI000B9C3C14|nr:hypothetical protein [Pseudoscardovia radai]
MIGFVDISGVPQFIGGAFGVRTFSGRFVDDESITSDSIINGSFGGRHASSGRRINRSLCGNVPIGIERIGSAITRIGSAIERRVVVRREQHNAAWTRASRVRAFLAGARPASAIPRRPGRPGHGKAGVIPIFVVILEFLSHL